MMKVTVAVLFICVVLAVASAKKCDNSDECEADECCVKGIIFSSRCQKMKKEGDLCIQHPDEWKEEGKFRFACPCVEGLECKKEEKDENSILPAMYKCHAT
ncbi:hypothetical protein X975_08255, partial [Stegodyphus mimosarum]